MNNEQIKELVTKQVPIWAPVAVGAGTAVVVGTASYLVGFRRGWKKGTTLGWMLAKESEEVTEAPVTTDEAPKVVVDDIDAVRERWQNDTQGAFDGEQVISERVLTDVEIREISLVADLDGTAPGHIVSVDGVPMAVAPTIVEQALAIAKGEAPAPEPPSLEEVSVFAGNTQGWNMEAEVAAREGNQIYVIHADEYYENADGYTQIGLTYYAGDDILAEDSGDQDPVLNYERVVGPMRFGHGSNDPNVFHVRNVGLETEYSIVRHTGMYSFEVMGVEIESERVPAKTRRMPAPDDTET